MSTSNEVHDMKNDTEEFLSPFIDAARDSVPADAVTNAANRLRTRVPRPETGSANGKSMFRFGTAAAMLAVVLLVGQTLIPGHSSNAFASVQQWFSDFRNVHVTTTISSANSVVVNVEVWALDNGTVRIEQNEMVQILDSSADKMFTLMPGGRYVEMALPANPEQPQALDWFEDIREFQGEATLMDDSRLVSGINAQGYQLQADGVDLTLWVDPVSYRPLLLEGRLPGGLEMISELDFDVEIQTDWFKVPPGFIQIKVDK